MQYAYWAKKQNLVSKCNFIFLSAQNPGKGTVSKKINLKSESDLNIDFHKKLKSYDPP